MLFEIIVEGFADGLLHGSRHLAVAKLGLGLSLKLRFSHLDGDDGSESLAEVLAGDFYFRLFYLFGNGGVGIGVGLQGTCEGDAESRQVCTSLDGVDVVDVRVDIL